MSKAQFRQTLRGGGGVPLAVQQQHRAHVQAEQCGGHHAKNAHGALLDQSCHAAAHVGLGQSRSLRHVAPTHATILAQQVDDLVIGLVERWQVLRERFGGLFHDRHGKSRGEQVVLMQARVPDTHLRQDFTEARPSSEIETAFDDGRMPAKITL
jgi:hypothetical protein